MRKSHLVAIGGGQVFVPCQPPETLPIDKYIVSLAKKNLRLENQKRKPRVLFIPTASGDDIYYCNTLLHIYEWLLGCEFAHLRLLAERLTDEEIRLKIRWADIIYIGGGNTYRMMRAWRRRGVDNLLREAYNHGGKVLCGLSAGAICWFDAGISDSRKKPGRKDWKPIMVKGLGLIPAACCPHYDSEGDWRQPACEKMLRSHPGLRLIVLEDRCALHVTDGILYRTVSDSGSGCYNMFHDGGVTFVEQIHRGTTASLFIS